VVEELNARLRLKIKPFKLTRRQILIDRLTYDPEVLAAVERLSQTDGVPRDVSIARVRGYAREIVPAFNAYLYFRVGCWLAQRTAQAVYRVRLGYMDEEGHAGVPSDSSVVFVMNHRSNFDYILIAYLVASRAALSYAVGEWARIWPLQTLIRSMGAYFIRRRSEDDLYRTVLRRYVHMATQAGVVQAVYPEGGLSRDGCLLPPRLGLLSYMLRSFDPAGERDLVFIPVGVNYDRVLEDRSLLRSVLSGSRRRGIPAGLAAALRFFIHNLGLMLRGRWHRLGYACVNFGTPVSTRQYAGEHGIDFRAMDRVELFRQVERFGRDLMDRIGAIVPVTPVALVASLFLQNRGKPMSELEVKAEAYALMLELESKGAQIYIPRGSQDYAVTVGLRMLTLRNIVDQTDGLYHARDEEEDILRYYANSIAQFRSGPIEERAR
jgi:glycerol-3-phosphate O-acyltransferase